MRDTTVSRTLDDGTEISKGAERLAMLKVHYRNNPVDFIQDWFVTYDPRVDGPGKSSYMPFLLFERQQEFIRWLWERRANREDGCVEKSRDMGITWLCMAYAIWMWLFHPGSKIAFGSRKETLVDKIGDPDSIFEKGRQLLRTLPIEFLPAGYKEDKDASFLKIINPENGATITGEAGDNIGRGGRSTMYFVDEAAFLDHPDRVESALSQNTDTEIWASTANGTGNPFFRKVHGGAYEVFRFHWTQDPRKGPEWYAAQKKKLEPHVLAQEVDIDYTASIERIVIPSKWIQAAVDINRMVEWPTYQHGRAGLDIGGGGEGKTVYCARFGPFVDPCVAWDGGNPTRDAFVSIELAKRDKVDNLAYDSVAVGVGAANALEEGKKWVADERVIEGPFGPRTERTMAWINIAAVNVGVPPSDTIWRDHKRAVEKFANLRAEIWWTARDRFLKTYEHVLFLREQEGGVEHPIDELIVMPDDPVLLSQLTLPTWDVTASGKIQIESKRAMKTRGIKSPDYADALMLTFVPASLAGDFHVSDTGYI